MNLIRRRPEMFDFLLRSSELGEIVLQRKVSSQARRQAEAAGVTLVDKILTPRLIKAILPNGTLEVLATSLVDGPASPAAEFGTLYQARRNIEAAFQLIKRRLLWEQFSGDLPKSIRQDVH
jgi:hypothetical protein